MRGWIKLHRKALANGWLRNHKLWAFWCYLLLRASKFGGSTKIAVNRNGSLVTIDVESKPGQLILGRKKAALDTGLSERNARTFLKYLEKNRSIIIKPTTNFSIVTICNWKSYQIDDDESDQQLTIT